MKIYIDQIPESGWELNQDCPVSSLDLEREDIKISEPINLSAWVIKEADSVSVRLKIKALLHLTCSRCLEEFTLPLARQISLNIPIEGKEVIDLMEHIREELILSYPLKLLCQPECRGLCPVCGKNLNKERCNHGTT